MIKYLYIILKCVLVVYISFSCKEDSYIFACNNGVVDHRTLGSLSPHPARLENLDPPTRNGYSVNKIITNQNDYKTYIYGFIILPKIDFKRNTLLCGMSYFIQEAGVESQDISINCAAKEITFNIYQKIGPVPGDGLAYYYAIVPKFTDEYRVKFVIHYLNL